MSDPFSAISGAIGIAAAFTACVDCFDYIQAGRHFKRDFQTGLVLLKCAKLRLARWGMAVNIHNDPNLGKPQSTPAEINDAKDILFQILVLFANAEKISKKYKPRREADEQASIYSTDDMDPMFGILHNQLKELSIKRTKKIGFLKAATWAVYHGSELTRLIENVSSLIENLEKLFPLPVPLQTKLDGRHAEEASEVFNDPEPLQNVGNLPLLQTAKQALAGHSYLNVEVRGQAHNGDTFGDDWRGNVVGHSHAYDGILVEKGAKVLNGNKYGGRDFWDS